jgi:hypothetical protein
LLLPLVLDQSAWSPAAVLSVPVVRLKSAPDPIPVLPPVVLVSFVDRT